VKKFSPLHSASRARHQQSRFARRIFLDDRRCVLSQELNISHIVLTQDLGAWGHSIEYLDPKQFLVLMRATGTPAARVRSSPRALALANLFCWDGKRYQVVLLKEATRFWRRIPNSNRTARFHEGAAIPGQ